MSKTAREVKHSTGDQEWYTPKWFAEDSRKVLGSIDLDPASCVAAQRTILATRCITKDEDALVTPWALTDKPVSVFCNPPGGRFESKNEHGDKMPGSLPAHFWYRLQDLRADGLLRHALWVLFSLEPLQVTQNLPDGCPPIADFAVCFFNRRVEYQHLQRGFNQPPHASAVAYIPGTENQLLRFIDVFEKHGRIMLGDQVL